MMHIRTAVPGDLPAFSALWKTAFHEGAAEARFVFERYARPEHIYVAEENESLLAILSAVPGQAEGNAGSYFYGLATRPGAQGRGIMTGLMDQVCGILQDQGQKFVCLVPASESLFEFYAQRGFRTAFYRLTGAYSGPPGPLPPYEAAPFSGEQKLSPAQFCFDPSSAAAMADSVGAVRLRTQAGWGVFLPAQDSWYCVELTHPEILDCALAQFKTGEIRLHCPALPALEGLGAVVPQGMIRVLDPGFALKTLYLSLDGSL